MEQKSPNPPAERGQPKQRASTRQVLRRRLATLGACLSLAAMSFVISGCPIAADLDNPNQYAAPSTTKCEVACVKTYFSKSSCGLCHGPAGSALQYSALDLVSAGATRRITNIIATHRDVPDAMKASCPAGVKLIDTANPAESWMLKKVNGMHAGCGSIMPQTAATPDTATVTCMQTYVSCVAAEAAAGGSSSGGTGGTGGAASGGAGGTGGTGTAGGGTGGTGGTGTAGTGTAGGGTGGTAGSATGGTGGTGGA